MSRYHCDLLVRQQPGTNAFEYLLSDSTHGVKKVATNGTFVNGLGRIKDGEQWPLKDGDTIQIGRTKLVLKLPGSAGSAQEAGDQVSPTSDFQTIIQ